MFKTLIAELEPHMRFECHEHRMPDPHCVDCGIQYMIHAPFLPLACLPGTGLLLRPEKP